VLDKGLDADGFIRREGDLALLQPAFAGLVAEFVAAVRAAFGRDLDSVYLYGSLARGAGRPGVSDVDGQVLLTRTPTAVDRAAVAELEAGLAAAHPEVSGVGVLLDARADLLRPAQRYDGGFHLRVLCLPITGPDAGAEVPPHRPGWELARGVQGDWRGALDALGAEGARLASGIGGDAGDTAPVEAAEAAFCRTVGRRLARIAFTWVMPRWRGWTSDPAVIARVVAEYEPGWASDVEAAVGLGWGQVVDAPAAVTLLTRLGRVLRERGDELGA